MRIYRYGRVESTQDVAKELIRKGGIGRRTVRSSSSMNGEGGGGGEGAAGLVVVADEQMKGRGTRTIDSTALQAVSGQDAKHKTHFVIVDAVGVCETDKTDSRPLERNKSIPFDKLALAVALGQRDEDTISSLAGRLARLDKAIDQKHQEQIRQAAGGKESALFASELLRMYTKYAEVKGWKLEILSLHPTDLGGIKEVSFGVKGKGAYAHFRFESGVHRVQRVPETEAGGRIHTSTVTVAVLKEPEEIELKIDPKELKIETFRASGAGGQHVNMTDSAVRITHLPTGISVSCQDERSQIKNREKAMRVLRARLMEYEISRRDSEISSQRKHQVGSGERSEKVRTYNFPQRRVTDHRIPISIYQLEDFLNGDMDIIIKPLILHFRKKKI